MANTNNKIESYFYPILATYDNESSDSLLNKWDKLDALSEINQNKISSQETAEKIKKISLTFHINQIRSSAIAISVRNYYFGELKLEDMPAVLAKEIPIDFSKAREITRLIIEKIINDKSQEIAYQSQLDNLPIDQALKAYPEIGEQLITSEKITLKNFPEPVRPSLKNWLADYDYTLYGKERTAIERGIYIFQSANGKRLSSQDRQKLAYLLKAHDEKTPVTVNKNLKQIIFSVNSEQRTVDNNQETRNLPTGQAGNNQTNSNIQSENRNINPQSSANLHSNISFSSPQKLPYEKMKSNPYTIKPVFGKEERPSQIKLQEKPRQMPNNVVNLKEDN